jgi:ABC-type dipeptide/oligopeptide/nickel transport system permease component
VVATITQVAVLFGALLAVTRLVGVVYSIVNILVDRLHGLIDPRVAAEL